MGLLYHVVYVFAERKYQVNQLAVVHAGERLPEGLMLDRFTYQNGEPDVLWMRQLNPTYIALIIAATAMIGTILTLARLSRN